MSQPVEQPFHVDLEYYEDRARGIASVNDLGVDDARRDLAARHGFNSWAALRRHVEAMRSGEQPPTPLLLAYQALEANDLDGLRQLLDRFPDLVAQRGTNGNDLLGMASSPEIVSLLLQRGADPNHRGTFGGPDHGEGVTAIHLAAQAGRRDAVRTLVELGADPLLRDNLHGGTALGWAQTGGHEDVIEILR